MPRGGFAATGSGVYLAHGCAPRIGLKDRSDSPRYSLGMGEFDMGPTQPTSRGRRTKNKLLARRGPISARAALTRRRARVAGPVALLALLVLSASAQAVTSAAATIGSVTP